MIFANRREAGKLLADKLASRGYDGEDTTIIYALPRGGVVLANEVARKLNIPLDLILVRKIGHPLNEEYAIGAIAENGEPVVSEDARQEVDDVWLAEQVNKSRAEIERRREVYMGGALPVSPQNKTAIIVDDGVATGLTARAAAEYLRGRGAGKVILAVPVLPKETLDKFINNHFVDDVVAIEAPRVYLGAVGAYYRKFNQLNDQDVIRILTRFKDRSLASYDKTY